MPCVSVCAYGKHSRADCGNQEQWLDFKTLKANVIWIIARMSNNLIETRNVQHSEWIHDGNVIWYDMTWREVWRVLRTKNSGRSGVKLVKMCGSVPFRMEIHLPDAKQKCEWMNEPQEIKSSNWMWTRRAPAHANNDFHFRRIIVFCR